MHCSSAHIDDQIPILPNQGLGKAHVFRSKLIELDFHHSSHAIGIPLAFSSREHADSKVGRRLFSGLIYIFVPLSTPCCPLFPPISSTKTSLLSTSIVKAPDYGLP